MATGDLTTAADVSTFLGQASNIDAALLGTLVTNASAFVLNYVNRNLLTASYTETRNGHGGSRLALREYPVTAVSSVTVDGVAIPAAPDAVSNGYVFDDLVLYLRGYCFTRGVQNVVIGYTAGYASVPADVAQACIEIVAAKYKRRTKLHLSSEAMDGQTTAFNQSDVPPSAKAVLNNYMRRYMV